MTTLMLSGPAWNAGRKWRSGSACMTFSRRRSAIPMIDQNTETGVFDSFARVAGPGSEGEGAARSNEQPENGRERRSEADDIRVCIHESAHALTGRLVA